MPLTCHERQIAYASEAVGLTNLFVEGFLKHTRSSDFKLGFLLFLIVYKQARSFERFFSERLIPPSRSRAWHGIYGQDLDLLGQTGRAQPCNVRECRDHLYCYDTGYTHNDTISRAERISHKINLQLTHAGGVGLNRPA